MVDLHAKWPHRWITKKAKAFSSEINGVGVVAVDRILKGEQVAVFGGIVVPKSEIEEYWKLVGHIGIQISDDFFIVPSTREEVEIGGVFNHSCNPNCGYSGSIILVAMKDIEASEELTFDYAFSETDKDFFVCNCGSKNCRKNINPDDWKLKELQDKYGDYFSQYIKDKISFSKN